MYNTSVSFRVKGDDPEKVKNAFNLICWLFQIQDGERQVEQDDSVNAAFPRIGCGKDIADTLTPYTKENPDVTFCVFGYGDDDDDHWRLRISAGACETVLRQEAWPPFKEILLPGEQPGLQEFPVFLTREELETLSEVFHGYKDYNRGSRDLLLLAQGIEARLVKQTEGAYEPDTTYDC